MPIGKRFPARREALRLRYARAMTAERAEVILKWLLFVLGGLAILAFVPTVMPTAWMEEATVELGLEVLPDTPLTQYLTRSLSMLYCVFGLLTVYLARGVRQYRQLLIYVGWLTLLLAIVLTILDFAVGMPAHWSWGEGPPTMVVALVIVWLARRTRPI